MRLLRLCFYIFIFFAGIGLGGFLFVKISLAGTGTVVPQVVTMKIDNAENLARKASMSFRITQKRYDLSIGKDRIVEQDPKAGMRIRKGTTLSVVVSKGIEKMTVPDFLGMERSEAERKAGSAGLSLRATTYIHRSATTPVVIAQYPRPSEVVPRESNIEFLVDMGPEIRVFAMPSLVGRNYEDVRRGLKLYGITVGPARTIRVADKREGEILGQSPKQGAPLTRSTLVQLTVNQ